MIRYRMLFLNRKTFLTAAFGAFFLLIVSIVLIALAGQLTISTLASLLLTLLLSIGLAAAWKNEDMIRVSGLVGGILLVELCHYIYISEQTLSIGVDTIVSQGLVRCMMLSIYLMISFIVLMVTYNHFTIFLGTTSGRTKFIVNQLSICALFLCFLSLTVENLLIGDTLLQQAASAACSLSDLCVFVMIACCELYMTVDGKKAKRIDR